MSYFEQAQELLKQHRYRMTQTRHQVLGLFAEKEKMLMPDEIQELAGDTKLDSATVYRILNVFEELDIVKKIHSLGGYVKVPLDRPNVEHRQFLIDEKTHRAIAIPFVDIDGDMIEKYPGFFTKKVYSEIIGSFDDGVEITEKEEKTTETEDISKDEGEQKQVPGQTRLSEEVIHEKSKDQDKQIEQKIVPPKIEQSKEVNVEKDIDTKETEEKKANSISVEQSQVEQAKEEWKKEKLEESTRVEKRSQDQSLQPSKQEKKQEKKKHLTQKLREF